MIYFVQHPEDKYIKIGATLNVDNRFYQLQKEYRSPLLLMGICEGYYEEETRLHSVFSEWCRFGEWFKPVEPILQYIELNTKPYTLQSRMTYTKQKKEIRLEWNFTKIPDHIPFTWRNPQKIISLLHIIRENHGELVYNKALDLSVYRCQRGENLRMYLMRLGIEVE